MHPLDGIRKACRVLDAHRGIAYLLLAALVVLALPVSYLGKLAAWQAAPPLPAEWTSSHGGQWDFSGSLRGHSVSFANLPVEREDGQGSGFLGWSFYGEYNPWTGSLRLAEDLQESGAESNLLVTARHEVGHALLDDIVAEACGDGFGGYLRAMATVQSTKLVTRSSGGWLVRFYPEALQAAYRAYLTGPAAGSGGGNADANLNEYFAESYAGLLMGFRPPAEMRAVFASYADNVPPVR